MLVSEDLERSWLRIAAPNGNEMAFSAERGSLTAQLLQDFGIALASPVEPSKPLHTPGPWFIRKRTDREGNLLDCFVAAKDVNGFAYDAEILGDDEYRDGIERKLADCELVVRAVNAALASPVAPAVQEPQTGLTEMGWIMESGTKGELAAYDQGCEECNHEVTRILDGKDNGQGVMREPTETLRRRLLELVRVPAPSASPPLDRLTEEQVRGLMQVALKWAGPDHNDSRSDILEAALRKIKVSPAVQEPLLHAFSCEKRVNGGAACERWCGDKESCISTQDVPDLIVAVERGRVWVKRGFQSFMLAYESAEPEELEWYAQQLRKVLAAPAPSAAPADGWVLVPKEPNNAMQVAGAQAIRMKTTSVNKLWTGNAVYRAMLAAAPGAASPVSKEPK